MREKENKVFPINRQLSIIFDEAYEEFKDEGISRDHIKKIFYDCFVTIKGFMQSYMFPVINIPGFGRFLQRTTKIELKAYSDKVSDEVSEIMQDSVYRIINENQKRKRKK